MVKTCISLCLVMSCLLLQACVGGTKKPPADLLALTEAQSKIRSIQVRTFEIDDRERALRVVIRALLDLGFVVERVNGPMGLVTAGKFKGNGLVELTSIVSMKNKTETDVRVNAVYNTRQIEDPEIYQKFFSVVQRSLASPR